MSTRGSVRPTWGEPGRDPRSERLDVDARVCDEADADAVSRLSNLVLEDLSMVAERRTEQVRVDGECVVVDEDVVEATLWVLDALHVRSAWARAGGEGDLVGHLVADQGWAWL
jgi:hypothetical protein